MVRHRSQRQMIHTLQAANPAGDHIVETAALKDANAVLAQCLRSDRTGRYTPEWQPEEERYKRVYAHVLALDKVALQDDIARRQGEWAASKANRHVVTGPQTEYEQRRQKYLQRTISASYAKWYVDLLARLWFCG